MQKTNNRNKVSRARTSNGNIYDYNTSDISLVTQMKGKYDEDNNGKNSFSINSKNTIPSP